MYQDHLRLDVIGPSWNKCINGLTQYIRPQARSKQSVTRVWIRPYIIYEGCHDRDVLGSFWPICIRGLVYKAHQVIGWDVSNPPWLRGIIPFIWKDGSILGNNHIFGQDVLGPSWPRYASPTQPNTSQSVQPTNCVKFDISKPK